MRLTIALFVVLLPAWGVGCGSGGPSAGDDQAFMSGLCELMESCCMKNGKTNLNPSSCKDNYRSSGSRETRPSTRPAWRSFDSSAPTGTASGTWGTWTTRAFESSTSRAARSPGWGLSDQRRLRRRRRDHPCWENSAGRGVCMRMARGASGQGTCLGDAVTTGGFFGPFLGRERAAGRLLSSTAYFATKARA